MVSRSLLNQNKAKIVPECPFSETIELGYHPRMSFYFSVLNQMSATLSASNPADFFQG
jgi:hypothetical protein